MKYLIEVQDTKDLKKVKQGLKHKTLPYNITTMEGEVLHHGLEGTKNTAFFTFELPDNIVNVNTYLLNNLDIVFLSSPFLHHSLFLGNVRSLFAEDVYANDCFVLSNIGDYNHFYVRSKDPKGEKISYRTVLNALRDYYADIWGLVFDFQKFNIRFTLNSAGTLAEVVVTADVKKNYFKQYKRNLVEASK